MKMVKSLFKRSAKPDYMAILAKAGKEMPVVIRRMIQHEGMQLASVYHLESRRHYDVILISEEPAERVLIVRHRFGSTQAHYQDFDPAFWRQQFDPERPDLAGFLDRYHQEVKPLDRSIWTA